MTSPVGRLGYRALGDAQADFDRGLFLPFYEVDRLTPPLSHDLLTLTPTGGLFKIRRTVRSLPSEESLFRGSAKMAV